jgi:dephospho-CoA kinase
MLRVGLTGGLASGKSFVGQALADLGCHLIRADELGHAVLTPGGEAYAAVVEEFGPAILEESGRIDRRKLAAEVFQRPERLAALNRLVHPPVIRREEQLSAQYRARDPQGIVVVEAAILIETGHYRRFDRIVLAVCSPEQQIERAMRRDGLSREEALVRLARQMPLDRKREFAHYVIDTGGPKDETLRQVQETFRSLRSIQQ